MNKASDGIPAELFQVLNDDAMKMLHSICQQIWKTQQWSQDWKSCFHSNPKEMQCQKMFKLPHNCTHFTCQQGHAQNPPSQASTIHEPIAFRCTSWIQKRQRNQNQIANMSWIIEKAREFPLPEKFTSASLTILEPLTVQITTNCGIYLKRCENQTSLTAS